MKLPASGLDRATNGRPLQPLPPPPRMTAWQGRRVHRIDQGLGAPAIPAVEQVAHVVLVCRRSVAEGVCAAGVAVVPPVDVTSVPEIPKTCHMTEQMVKARAGGAREITTIVAVGNHGRGPGGPCGRDRQVLFDYRPSVRVILPTGEGVKSVLISDLMPLAALWTVEGGTQPYNPALFREA